MIERAVFATWMSALADRIGRPLTVPTLAAYYAALSAQLNTAQFEQAAQAVFAAWRFPNWPPPAEFITAVVAVPPIALEAAAAWTAITGVLTQYSPPSEHAARWRAAALAAGAPGWCAFNAAGGRSRWSTMLEGEQHWMRKDFLAAYPAAKQFAEAPVQDVQALPSPVRALVERVAAARAMPQLPRGSHDHDR